MKEKIMITYIDGIYRLEHEVNGITFVKNYKRENDAIEMKEKLEAFEVVIDQDNVSASKTKLGYVATVLLDQNRKANTLPTVKKKITALTYFAHLKDKKMGEITNEDLVGVIKNAKNKRTGEHLMQGTLAVLKAVMKELYAIVQDMGFQRTNLRMVWAEIDKIIKGAKPPKNKRSLLKKEVVEWLKSEETERPYVRDLSKLLLLSSSRISEWIGCTFDKIDLENRTVYMCQMVSAHIYYPRLKMFAKPYTIKMCDAMYVILKRRKEENDAKGDKKSDWLFPALQKTEIDFAPEYGCPYKGRPVSYNTYRRALKRDMQKANLKPIHIHGLRISSVTMLYIENITNPFVKDMVQRRLNHKYFSNSEGYLQVADEIIEGQQKTKIKNGLEWLTEEDKDAA